MSETWIVENTWLCPTCQAQNRGRYMRCQTCGQDRPKESQDIIPNPDSAPQVSDTELLALAYQAPNWECHFCHSQTRDQYGKCQVCGAENNKSSNDLNVLSTHPSPQPEPAAAGMEQQDPEVDQTLVTTSGSVKGKSYWIIPLKPFTMPLDQFERECKNGLKQSKNKLKQFKRRFTSTERLHFWIKRNKTKLFWAVGISTALGLLIGLLIYLIVPRIVLAPVTSLYWKRTTTIEQRFTKSGEGWGSPIGAFNSSCHTRQRGTENCHPRQCNPHSQTYNCNPRQCNCSNSCTSNKNGFSTCSRSCSTCYSSCSRTVYDTCYDQCPVYDNWCIYNYYSWDQVFSSKASGINHKVYWPKVPELKPLQRYHYEQSYGAIFKIEHDEWNFVTANVTEFNRYNVKDVWKIKVNRAGSVWPLEKAIK
jgi:hypothetical protein